LIKIFGFLPLSDSILFLQNQNRKQSTESQFKRAKANPEKIARNFRNSPIRGIRRKNTEKPDFTQSTAENRIRKQTLIFKKNFPKATATTALKIEVIWSHFFLLEVKGKNKIQTL